MQTKNQIVVNNKVILDLIQDLQRVPLQLINSMRGRFQIKFGMTFLYSRAFTLIELLVVVLIIGILTAVAVPQYKMAVYKSRYATLKNLTKSIAVAQDVYYLANGQYATSFEELDIDMPGSKTDQSTNDRYVYDWGLCMISYTQAMCHNYKIQMTYQQRYSVHPTMSQTRVCVSHITDENSIQSQICKMETGETTHSGGAGYFGYLYKN